MSTDKNFLYICENCPLKGDHFKTGDKWKWEKQHICKPKHLKNIKLAEESGIVCPYCNGKFTKEGYEFHKRNNKKLHNLIHRRNNHKSFSVYNQDTWQLGYKEYNGHNGENLPKCGTYKAFRKQFGTFEQMEEHIYKKWDRYKIDIRNIKMGALPDPWEELIRDDLAEGGVGDGYESDEWNEEMDRHQEDEKEKQKIIKKQETINRQLIKFKNAGFDVTKIHKDGGYSINFIVTHQSLKTETMSFFQGLGYYYWDNIKHKIYQTFIEIQSDYPNRNIVYLPDDLDDCLWTGVFFIDFEGETEDLIIATSSVLGNVEIEIKFYELDSESSDEEVIII